MARMSRSVSYCVNPECDDAGSGRFHLGKVDPETYCNICHQLSTIVPETFDYSGGQPYRQVRVEYDYFAPEARYRGLAIVTNEAIPEAEGGIHTFRSPLIKTPKRALTAAEHRLSNLSQGQQPDQLHTTVNFDKPFDEVKRELEAFGTALDDSGLAL